MSCGRHFTFYFYSSTVTYDEWSSFTHDNLVKITQEQNNCPPLKSFIDNSIRQCIEDLITQRDYTNAAFRRRIAETKEAKTQLEARHAEVTINFRKYSKISYN